MTHWTRAALATDLRRRRAPVWGWLAAAGFLIACFLAMPAGSAPTSTSPARPGAEGDPEAMPAKRAKLLAELKRVPHKIAYESYRGTNWELFVINADGSNPVNLTRTPKVDELYPHASPDGSRICFAADEGKGRSKVRSVYYMNADGSGRTLVAENARHPCWGPGGRAIAYTPGEYDRFSAASYATKGLAVYDLQTGQHRRHPNRSIRHLYALTWSPDSRWFLATVHGGMGYDHADLAIEAEGERVFTLPQIEGCRPDISADGKKILWNATDQSIAVADLDLKSSPPGITNIRIVVSCQEGDEVYHADWSPDGKYIAFAHGPEGDQSVGQIARGWNICVADASQNNVWVRLTTDGVSNKEPDWVPAGNEGEK